MQPMPKQTRKTEMIRKQTAGCAAQPTYQYEAWDFIRHPAYARNIWQFYLSIPAGKLTDAWRALGEPLAFRVRI